jgi:competence CoiA-like predicted nuclease
MPFIAKNKKTGSRVDITEYKQPRLEINKEDLMCPFCHQDMLIVQGVYMIPHFRHKAECTSDYDRHPESIEHLIGKKLVADMVKRSLQEFTSAECLFEYPVKEIKRIIDVAFVFPMGWIIAHEIQLSPITPEILDQRTNDYFRAGINVYWWFGKGADNDRNKKWAIDNFGEYLQIDYEELSEIKRNFKELSEVENV